MTEDDLFGLMDPPLRERGSTSEPGEEFLRPALDVVRYYGRPVKWNAMPVLGRALSVVAVVRQPLDLAISDDGYGQLLVRVSMAVGGRFPLWKAAVLGLAVVVLTYEPIGLADEEILDRVLAAPLRRYRAVPFGLIRVNLGQEAVAYSLRASPGRLFPEAQVLAVRLGESLRRFLPPLEF
ncbi:MAG: hypothetical protein U0790_27525 [Isosphaeraceae bacterium]